MDAPARRLGGSSPIPITTLLLSAQGLHPHHMPIMAIIQK